MTTTRTPEEETVNHQETSGHPAPDIDRATQLRAMREYARTHGLAIVREYIDEAENGSATA